VGADRFGSRGRPRDYSCDRERKRCGGCEANNCSATAPEAPPDPFRPQVVIPALMISHPSRVTYARGFSLTHPARDVTKRPNDYYKSGMRRLVAPGLAQRLTTNRCQGGGILAASAAP
jgi:hypothetical protein